MDLISPLPTDDKEEIVAESSPRGSRWTIEKHGDSQRLLTLSVSDKEYSGCAMVETTQRGRIKRTKVVPWHKLQVGNYVLLGDFWPIRLKESELLYPGRPKRVDAVVKVRARRTCNMVEVQVVWVATNAAPHHELHVDKVLKVPLGELALWKKWNPFALGDQGEELKRVRVDI